MLSLKILRLFNAKCSLAHMKENIPKAVRIGGKGAPRIVPKKKIAKKDIAKTILPFKKDTSPMNADSSLFFTNPPVTFQKPKITIFSHKKKQPYAYIISGVPEPFTQPENKVISSSVSNNQKSDEDEVLNDLRDRLNDLDGSQSQKIENEQVIELDGPCRESQSLEDLSLNVQAAERIHVDKVDDNTKEATRETLFCGAISQPGSKAEEVDTQQITLTRTAHDGKQVEHVDVFDAKIAHASGDGFELNLAEVNTVAEEDSDCEKKNKK